MSELKTQLKTTPRYIKLLTENGIYSLRDFFNYFPRAYEDRGSIKPLNALILNDKGTTATKGQIIKKSVFRRGNKMIYTIDFEDENGQNGVISIFNS